MSLKRTIKALVPSSLLSIYHLIFAGLAVLFYGWPARRLTVIGITGTKGKTSTAGMLWHILENNGYKTALVSTAFFALGKETWLNDLKMTMPSRFKLQKFLRQAVRVGCTHAVIETSSEGLAQWRHLGLPYSRAVFTNFSPEHIEAHGSIENYRLAKARLFQASARHGGTAVINLDDSAAEFFAKQAGLKVWGYSFKNSVLSGLEKKISAHLREINSRKIVFEVGAIKVDLPIGGEFNAYNTLAAMVTALSLGVSLEKSVQLLLTYAGTPGRLEFIQQKPFAVVVDYAHTTESLEAVYKILSDSGGLIAVLGSCGGGRDRAKRAPLGKLAGKHADYVIVTNEDPYDEPPRSIMETVARGVKESGKKENENYWIVEDRREAIKKALALANSGDTVVITGKGAEQWLMQTGGKKIPWDDREVVRDELKKLENTYVS